MNFSNFSKKFFKTFTGNNMKFSKINIIKNNFRRSFLFNKVQLCNLKILLSSSISRNALPFLSLNGIANTDNFISNYNTETELQNLLDGIIHLF